SYLSRQKYVRQLATGRAVDDALAQADLARGRAEGTLDPAAEVNAWREALNHARRAQDALDSGEPTPAIRSFASSRLGQFQEGLQVAEARLRDTEVERRLVGRLEDVRGRRAEHLDPAQTDRDYADAFREAGLDLDVMRPDEAATWIEKRQAAGEIVAGIDDW